MWEAQLEAAKAGGPREGAHVWLALLSRHLHAICGPSLRPPRAHGAPTRCPVLDAGGTTGVADECPAPGEPGGGKTHPRTGQGESAGVRIAPGARRGGACRARCRPQLGPSHPRELPALSNPSEPASSPAEPGHSPSRASGVSWRLGTSRPSRERFAHRVSQPPLLGLQIYEFADDAREGSVTPNSTLRARVRSLESKRRAGRNSESPAARSRRRRDTVAPGPSGQCYRFHTPARLVFFGW